MDRCTCFISSDSFYFISPLPLSVGRTFWGCLQDSQLVDKVVTEILRDVFMPRLPHACSRRRSGRRHGGQVPHTIVHQAGGNDNKIQFKGTTFPKMFFFLALTLRRHKLEPYLNHCSTDPINLSLHISNHVSKSNTKSRSYWNWECWGFWRVACALF